MSNTKFSNFKSEDGNTGPDLVGITSFTSPYYFVPPSGTTAQRPSNAVPGQLRFNTDIGRLEVWRGDHWATILGQESASIGGRGIFGGGNPAGTQTNILDYITISSTGNAIDFGDLTVTRGIYQGGGVASVTRGLWGGGYAPGSSNVIDYVTISSIGNAVDFGDLTQARFGAAGCSSAIRGIWMGGLASPTPNTDVNTIDYITISSTGNAADFGDLTVGRRIGGSCSSPTRGIYAGGESPTTLNTIDYITIASTGNAQDFGDLSQAATQLGGCSNSIRGIFYTLSSTNIIEYITISTTSNSTDFGDLYLLATFQPASVTSPTRAVIAGGVLSPTSNKTNTIQFLTISTIGNTQDFGDLTEARTTFDGCSNGHGGL